jgi:hypothetical protein
VDDPDCGLAIRTRHRVDPTQAFEQSLGAGLERAVRLIEMELDFFVELSTEFEDSTECRTKTDLAFAIDRTRAGQRSAGMPRRRHSVTDGDFTPTMRATAADPPRRSMTASMGHG